jgi:hypothetical protein
MPKTVTKKSKQSRGALQMIDPERFTQVRQAFARRGLGGLSLVAMCRIVIDEWLKSDK